MPASRASPATCRSRTSTASPIDSRTSPSTSATRTRSSSARSSGNCGDDEVVEPWDDDVPNDPLPRPWRVPDGYRSAPRNWVTGMGSAAGRGGPVGGALRDAAAGGSSLSTSAGGVAVSRVEAGRYVVRVTLNGTPLPFATEVAEDGYFFLPLMPAGLDEPARDQGPRHRSRVHPGRRRPRGGLGRGRQRRLRRLRRRPRRPGRLHDHVARGLDRDLDGRPELGAPTRAERGRRRLDPGFRREPPPSHRRRDARTACAARARSASATPCCRRPAPSTSAPTWSTAPTPASRRAAASPTTACTRALRLGRLRAPRGRPHAEERDHRGDARGAGGEHPHGHRRVDVPQRRLAVRTGARPSCPRARRP